ncbi:hypothetical protein GCM10011491_05320 [Brucella endophytica]|uniref:DUF72 domain-containing protein n=1 Tax=Brucella endophytica TaxID=1963359 RepID=A0A916S4G8_9HYPH|nr:DUF72 domain-containing protein [Brucella endophytica]GGA80978.1 hypothetical protein GCM10011491_05320 [Brucella endophytica]
MATKGTIRAGIGGWTFEPWEGTFYPDDLPKKKQLEYASRQLATIEINGTYYGSQKPETFAKWASEVPDGFVFSLKGNRFVTNRRVLAEAGESVERFLTQGVTELGPHLGPILWQFAPTKKFDEADFEAFLKLLPEKQDGLKLRHTVEVRHPSFAVPEFVALARKYNVAVTCAEHFDYPEIADVTADFVYARLQKGDDNIPTAYSPSALDRWMERAELWAKGGAPDDLACADPQSKAPAEPRDVFVYFIHEGKIRAPNAARAFMERVEKAG